MLEKKVTFIVLMTNSQQHLKFVATFEQTNIILALKDNKEIKSDETTHTSKRQQAFFKLIIKCDNTNRQVAE